MALAWIEEREDGAEDVDYFDEQFSAGAPCRAATWESPLMRRDHLWRWAEGPALPQRTPASEEARLQHALAELKRLSGELQDLMRSAFAVPSLEESLRATIRQISESLDHLREESQASAAHELIDWRSVNRKQWERGVTAVVDEDGNPVSVISTPARLQVAVESDAEEPLLDE